MILDWKNKRFKKAGDFMRRSAAMVSSHGYVENAWGRRRYFPEPNNRIELAQYEREAQNMPIQSTVADTINRALIRLQHIRKDLGLKFRIFNQIHDACLTLQKESEVDSVKAALKEAMGSINIPTPGAVPLRLDVDIGVYKRWSEKQK